MVYFICFILLYVCTPIQKIQPLQVCKVLLKYLSCVPISIFFPLIKGICKEVFPQKLQSLCNLSVLLSVGCKQTFTTLVWIRSYYRFILFTDLHIMKHRCNKNIKKEQEIQQETSWMLQSEFTTSSDTLNPVHY